MMYAVIDTNVLVSAMITSNEYSSTIQVMKAMMERRIVPLYNDEIISEYSEVLHRAKFGFSEKQINLYLDAMRELGIPSQRIHSSEVFPDPNDIVFYEVALSKENAFLVTGNIKHFPKTPIVVTPSEMMEILKSD